MEEPVVAIVSRVALQSWMLRTKPWLCQGLTRLCELTRWHTDLTLVSSLEMQRLLDLMISSLTKSMNVYLRIWTRAANVIELQQKTRMMVHAHPLKTLWVRFALHKSAAASLAIRSGSISVNQLFLLTANLVLAVKAPSLVLSSNKSLKLYQTKDWIQKHKSQPQSDKKLAPSKTNT